MAEKKKMLPQYKYKIKDKISFVSGSIIRKEFKMNILNVYLTRNLLHTKNNKVST